MKRLENLSEINTNTPEGRLLMAAMAKISTESQTDKTPDDILEQCYLLQEEMFRDALPIPIPTDQESFTFEIALERLINSYSQENESNTPDYMLANFMIKCLNAFNEITNLREQWYGIHCEPGQVSTNKSE